MRSFNVCFARLLCGIFMLAAHGCKSLDDSKISTHNSKKNNFAIDSFIASLDVSEKKPTYVISHMVGQIKRESHSVSIGIEIIDSNQKSLIEQ